MLPRCVDERNYKQVPSSQTPRLGFAGCDGHNSLPSAGCIRQPALPSLVEAGPDFVPGYPARTGVKRPALAKDVPIGKFDCGRSTSQGGAIADDNSPRSEEHTSELQSLRHLVCRLL